MQRMGSVVEVKPEAAEEYVRLHAEVWPGVLAALTAANVTNYSIFQYGNLLFSYWEYLGDDLDADMAAIAADPDSQKWHELMSGMLRPVPEAAPGKFDHFIPEVFHLD
jgi:L-rhamnose mutarotase